MNGSLPLKPSEMDSARKTDLENIVFKQNKQISNFGIKLTQMEPESETLTYDCVILCKLTHRSQ